jgi:iodotyrosine deiodinase
MSTAKFIPLASYHEYPPAEMQQRATALREELQRRRTVRHFSDRPVSRAVIAECLRAASTAPSGANKQPWHFVVVSDPVIKRQIREGAEKEEREFYTSRATSDWLDDLAPLGTDEYKPFLEIAPYLIAIFAESYSVLPDGRKAKNYYVTESVGIAAGMLIAAIHHAGLVSLTHTPSPMNFLNTILQRPDNERPFLLLVVGYPAADAVVPETGKKPLEEVSTWMT